MRAVRVNYNPKLTGNGRVEIQRSNFGELRHGPSTYEDAYVIQSIGNQAWKSSDWLKELAAQHNVSPETLAAYAFDPDSADKLEKQAERIEKSQELGRRVVYWVGAVINDPRRWPHPYHRQGFVKIGQDGASANAVGRAIQRTARRGIYACIHDLNVRPQEQGKGLGTAQAYVGLADQPKRMKSSLYTAATNEPMVTWAEKYGYKVTDEYEDNETLGVPIPMLRYQAPSVGGVLEKMEEAHPWLAEGERASMLGMMLDEAEADIIYHNAR